MPRVCWSGPAGVPEPSDRPEGALFPTPLPPSHVLTSSAAILMVRGLWGLALEGQSPPGSAATLMACLPAVTAPPALRGGDFPGVCHRLLQCHQQCNVLYRHPDAHHPSECPLGQQKVRALFQLRLDAGILRFPPALHMAGLQMMACHSA